MTNDEKIDALQSRLAASRDRCFDEDERRQWDWLEEFRALLADHTKPEPCPDIKGFVSGGGLDHVMSKARAWGAVPPGWRLVPVEPTEEMVEAFLGRLKIVEFLARYRAMLNAAPEAPKP